jgi:hypothetical protein
MHICCFSSHTAIANLTAPGHQLPDIQSDLLLLCCALTLRLGRVVVREFATRPEVSGPLGELQELISQLVGLMTKNPSFTDNASVSLQPVRRAGGGGGPLLMAMSETPPASYIINPIDLTTMEQVGYTSA